MSLVSFEHLRRQCDDMTPRVSVVAAGGADSTVLEALSVAEKRGWVQPIVCGVKSEIQAVVDRDEIEFQNLQIIDAADAGAAAVAAIRSGQAAILMKGQIATPDLMQAILDRATGLRLEQTIAQVVLMEIFRDKRSFLMTDTGINITLNIAKKRELVQVVARMAKFLADPTRPGGDRPRVALMAATEKPNENMPDSVEAATIASEFASLTDAIVAGPLSFDLAYAADAGAKKQLDGDVVGAADVMVFPNLQAANLTVKAIMYTADCAFGGVLVGAKCPVVFMSRADSVETRLHSLVFTLATLPLWEAE